MPRSLRIYLVVVAFASGTSIFTPAPGAAGATCTRQHVIDLVRDEFVPAYNKGRAQRLDRIFSKEPEFQWYSVSPDERERAAASDRSTLIDYFELRHDLDDRIRLIRLSVSEERAWDKGWHFNFRFFRRSDETGASGRYHGKGAAQCSIYVWSMGREQPLRCSEPTLVGTRKDDVLVGTPGRDVIAARGGDDTIRGRGASDRICGQSGNDKIVGGSGRDLAYGSGGVDFVRGGRNDDLLRGGRGKDRLAGHEGSDRLHGGTEADVLRGGRSGDRGDTLMGGGGNDSVWGGAGKDVLSGGRGDDGLDGGDGVDLIVFEKTYDETNDPVMVDLSSGTSSGRGSDQVSNVENVRGTDLGDTLIGDGEANLLEGGSGDDRLDGGGGSDVLVGGPGFDACLNGEENRECE